MDGSDECNFDILVGLLDLFYLLLMSPLAFCILKHDYISTFLFLFLLCNNWTKKIEVVRQLIWKRCLQCLINVKTASHSEVRQTLVENACFLFLCF